MTVRCCPSCATGVLRSDSSGEWGCACGFRSWSPDAVPCDRCGASADWVTGGGAAGEFYSCAGCRAAFDAEPDNAGIVWTWIGRTPEPPLVLGDAAEGVAGAPGWVVVLLVVGAVAVAVYVAAGLVS